MGAARLLRPLAGPWLESRTVHPPSGEDPTQRPPVYDVPPLAESVSVPPPTTGTSTGESAGAVSPPPLPSGSIDPLGWPASQMSAVPGTTTVSWLFRFPSAGPPSGQAITSAVKGRSMRSADRGTSPPLPA